MEEHTDNSQDYYNKRYAQQQTLQTQSSPTTSQPVKSSIMSKLAITPERRASVLIVCGAGVGIGQTVLLKSFVDGSGTTLPSWMPNLGLGTFNQPSALFGIAGGVARYTAWTLCSS